MFHTCDKREAIIPERNVHSQVMLFFNVPPPWCIDFSFLMIKMCRKNCTLELQKHGSSTPFPNLIYRHFRRYSMNGGWLYFNSCNMRVDKQTKPHRKQMHPPDNCVASSTNRHSSKNDKTDENEKIVKRIGMIKRYPSSHNMHWVRPHKCLREEEIIMSMGEEH